MNEKLQFLLNQQKNDLEAIRKFKSMNFIQTISENDAMYSGNRDIYFLNGKSALKCIEMCLSSAGKDISDIKKILDLPCGYGRVLRFLKSAFPQSQITACDLIRDAVDFCAKTFDVNPKYSSRNITDLNLESKFDLIWVGSLFTHLDLSDWNSFMKFFIKHLNSGGIIIFTTAGRFVSMLIENGALEKIDEKEASNLLKNFKEYGFGHANYPNSKNNWGRTVVQLYWVLSFLVKFPELRLINYNERGWGGRQDVIACIKE